MWDSEQVSAYRALANQWGDAIIAWARPEGWPEAPTKDWPFASFDVALAIALAYFVFVVVGATIGKMLPEPAIKKDGEKPKEDKSFFGTVMYALKFVYNIVQIMLCSYMCIEAVMLAYRNNYTLLPCEPFDHKDPKVANLLWLFYISKILDFCDTFFIVMGRKWKQLSFLHVYHHISIFLFYWLNLNVGYDGDVYLTIVLNGFIHTVMYTYYFVSMHADKIWWKSALTLSQMVQFVTMNAQAAYLIGTGCTLYPPNIIKAYLIYIVSLLVLFMNFFIKSYLTKGNRKNKGDKSKAKTH